MRELIEMIESAIEREREIKGAMGTESVSVSFSMTDEELDIFVGNIKKFAAMPGSANDNYAVRITQILKEEE